LAEGEGFEPPVGCPTAVFKTAALDHSAIPPGSRAPLSFASAFYHAAGGVSKKGAPNAIREGSEAREAISQGADQTS
jgi:hypothetical protein